MKDIHCPQKSCQRLLGRIEEETGELELFCRPCKLLTHFSLKTGGHGAILCLTCDRPIGAWDGKIFERRCRTCKATNRYLLRQEENQNALLAIAVRGSIR